MALQNTARYKILSQATGEMGIQNHVPIMPEAEETVSPARSDMWSALSPKNCHMLWILYRLPRQTGTQH